MTINRNIAYAGNLLFQAVFFLLTIIVFKHAPVACSQTYCSLLMWIFILQNVIYFIFTNRPLLSFEFFFGFTFWACNYIFPVFYSVAHSDYSFFGYFPINMDYVNVSTAISSVAYSSYLLCLSCWVRRYEKLEISKNELFSKRIQTNTFVLSTILMTCYILYIGPQMFGTYGWYFDPDNYTPLASLAKLSVLLFSIILWKEYKNYHKQLHLFLWMLCILIFLLSGSRHFPLALMIVFICSFSENIKKVNVLFFIFLLIFGIFCMFIIQRTRLTGFTVNTVLMCISSILNGSVLFESLEDLTINNRNLYALVEYANVNGFTHGQNMLSGILGLIPYAGTLYTKFTGIDMSSLQTSQITSELANADFGLGGHIVADTYLAFGMTGTIICFGLLGIFIGYLIKHYKTRPTVYITYFIMLSASVFINREFLLYPLRDIVYSILLYLMLSSSIKINGNEAQTVSNNSDI